MFGTYNHGWMFEGGGMLFGSFSMILILIVLVLAILALLRHLFGKPMGGSNQENKLGKRSALDVLKDVNARGDISREEYFQKRDDLLEK